MARNEREADLPSSGSPTSWRAHAVARSLDSARSRAEKRVQGFLDAALELLATESGRDLTVQEVVARSGQSLRSFYQYFAGKHELLLALFEESVRATADHLQALVADESDPLERLRRFAVEYHRLCRSVPETPSHKAISPALVDFAQQLLTDDPREAVKAYAPLASLLEQLLGEAAAAGRIRPGLDHRRLVGVLLQSISFHTFSTTIGGMPGRAADDDDADGLWELLLHGIGAVAEP